jgi:hypothetical protein
MIALLEREESQILPGEAGLFPGLDSDLDSETPTVHTPAITLDGRPDPKRVRGRCPECGEELVSNMYYLGGKGYLLVWECWASLADEPVCCYRRVV